jgi:kynurenine formamidase
VGRTEWGTYSTTWKAPDYVVNEDGKIVGLDCERQPNNWGRWGELDERGTTNLITPEKIVEAARLISDGRIISMAAKLEPNSPSDPTRAPIQHYWRFTGADWIAGTPVNAAYPKIQVTDDYINMPTHGSTQWDGLAHSAEADAFYNGFWLGTCETVTGANRCSIHQQRETLCGRGVLLDIPRHKRAKRLEPAYAIGPEDLDEVIAAQAVEVRDGDILIIRTGHLGWWYELAPNERGRYFEAQPGLSVRCVEWIHEQSIAAIAMDNMAVEVIPAEEPGAMIPLHPRLIRDLGLSIGENWDLDPIAEDCARDGRYEFFVAAQPLNIQNAAGSPINPIAIK